MANETNPASNLRLTIIMKYKILGFPIRHKKTRFLRIGFFVNFQRLKSFFHKLLSISNDQAFSVKIN